MSTSTIRRVFFKRRPSNLIALALEHPVIFNIILVLYSLIAPILYESLIKVPIPRYVALLLVVLVPGAVVIQLYLSNLSLSRRAELAVRFRSHDDTLVLSLLAEEILSAVDYADRRITWGSRLLRRAPTKEKIRSHGIYLTMLFDWVSDHFKVSRDVLEDLFGTPVRALTSRLESLVITNLKLSRNPDLYLSQSEVLRLEAEKRSLEKSMDNLRGHLDVLSKFIPDAPRLLHQIVKEASTGKAAAEAGEFLAPHCGDINHHDFVKHLLSLRRGLPLSSLLGFEELILAIREGKVPVDDVESYYCLFGEMARDSTWLLSENAANFIARNLRRGELIVTFGFSNTVAQVIEVLARKNADFQVVVIEPEKDWELLISKEDGKLMEARLKEVPALRRRVTRDNIDSFLEKGLYERKPKIYLGVEGVRSNGTIIHPKGRRDLLRRIFGNQERKECQVYMFAESYKFIELDEEIYSSPHLVTFAPVDDYDFLITERKVFSASDVKDGSFDFDNIKRQWETFVDSYLRELGSQPIFQKLVNLSPQKSATTSAPAEALSKEEHARIVAALDEVTALSQETGPPVSNRDHDAYLYGKH